MIRTLGQAVEKSENWLNDIQDKINNVENKDKRLFEALRNDLRKITIDLNNHAESITQTLNTIGTLSTKNQSMLTQLGQLIQHINAQNILMENNNWDISSVSL